MQIGRTIEPCGDKCLTMCLSQGAYLCTKRLVFNFSS